jgi:hypothetical protein
MELLENLGKFPEISLILRNFAELPYQSVWGPLIWRNF